MHKFGLIKENILNEKERYLVDTDGNSWESLYTEYPHPYYIATDINKRIVGMFDDPKEMTLGNLIVYGIDDNQGYTYHYNGTINDNKAWDETTNSIVDYKVPYPDESRPDVDTLGFMVQNMYDPTKKESDTFSMGSMEETENALILTPDERAKISNSPNKSVTITGSDGLTGGGDLTTNREISLSKDTKTSLEKANSAIQSGDLGRLAKKNSVALTDIDDDVLLTINIKEKNNKYFVTDAQKKLIDGSAQTSLLKNLAYKDNISVTDIVGYDSNSLNKILTMDGWKEIDMGTSVGFLGKTFTYNQAAESNFTSESLFNIGTLLDKGAKQINFSGKIKLNSENTLNGAYLNKLYFALANNNSLLSINGDYIAYDPNVNEYIPENTKGIFSLEMPSAMSLQILCAGLPNDYLDIMCTFEGNIELIRDTVDRTRLGKVNMLWTKARDIYQEDGVTTKTGIYVANNSSLIGINASSECSFVKLLSEISMVDSSGNNVALSTYGINVDCAINFSVI